MIVAYLSIGLFFGLIVYMVYFQTMKSEALLNDPRNHRQELVEQEDIIRGPILDRNGNVLAETQTDGEGNEYRVYPYGYLFSQTVGYAKYGGAGLEASENAALVSSHENIVTQIQTDLEGNKKHGDAVVSTLDLNLQQAASYALGDFPGAVLVMEADSGKVLADISNPYYDPNYIEENWDSLLEREDAVFLNRPLQGLYPPGSTFKMVTALAYLRKAGSFNDFHYNCTGEISLGGFTIHCANGGVHGEQTFADAMANSCNCAFAHLAAEVLDAEELRAAAEALGFNHDLNLDLPSTESIFSMDGTTPQALAMQTGIGQGDTLATPMQMCMIAQAIANNGHAFAPSYVERIESADGVTVRKGQTKPLGQVLSDYEAKELAGVLGEVVLRGTATELSDLPFRVAGKTGTAQYGEEGRSHSWFVGFTRTGGKDIVVCALTEGGGDGIYSATYVAKQVLYVWGNQ